MNTRDEKIVVRQQEYDPDRHGDSEPPWFLADPETGEPALTRTTEYRYFGTREEAIAAVVAAGCRPISD